MRLECGVSAEEAADELGISLATMSRIENGKTSVGVSAVRALCAMYEHPELAEAFAALAKSSKAKSPYRAFSDVIPEWFDVYIGLEQAAASFRWYEAQLVPGILQTGDYARTVVRTDHPEDAEVDVDRRVQLRLKRQALLTRRHKTPTWEIILDEGIVHRPIGGSEVMCEQLQRLREVADLPNVTLGIVPFDAGVHTGVTSGPFVLLDFPINTGRRQPKEPTTVYVEGFTGALYSDEQAHIEKYQIAFDGMRRVVLPEVKAKALLERAMKEMKRT